MKQGLFYNRLLANESFDMTPVIDVAFLLIIFYAGMPIYGGGKL